MGRHDGIQTEKEAGLVMGVGHSHSSHIFYSVYVLLTVVTDAVGAV